MIGTILNALFELLIPVYAVLKSKGGHGQFRVDVVVTDLTSPATPLELDRISGPIITV